MFLNKVTIKNLWDKKPTEINFDKKVTILTGVNGSGKSSILNIIYDSLSIGSSSKVISTSKSRMWVSKCELSNGINIQNILLSPLPDSKKEHVSTLMTDFLNSKDYTSFLSDSFTDKIMSIYTEIPYKTHVFFTKRNNDESISHGKISSFEIPDGMSTEDGEVLIQTLASKSNAFIFQEDRRTLHDISKSNIDPTISFWKTYSSSIDQRFYYIRDAMHIKESIIDSERSKLIDLYNDEDGINFDKLTNDPAYKENNNSRKEISKIYSLLNTYFNKTGKEITKDQEDHKITLKMKDSEETLSWHLLSRGEKTLIYLFFAIYLYRDKVEIFLLDEPEISLHVQWQEHLLKDLTDVSPNSQFIVTTHSPHLVMNGWMTNCLTVNLFGGEKNVSN
ncbi:AAA family ATPase [Aeromonas hydrophila]|uniref:AAA family ATPase n=1 Tax=Aeromonas hydrophila TaxID=644 RepID=UPI002366E58A|nr:ATP-binding protein [Aeromonas hydrophila]WDF91723.1 AAA family ATPase [Aeromonas hydrophila subsp. hydrophila]